MTIARRSFLLIAGAAMVALLSMALAWWAIGREEGVSRALLASGSSPGIGDLVPEEPPSTPSREQLEGSLRVATRPRETDRPPGSDRPRDRESRWPIRCSIEGRILPPPDAVPAVGDDRQVAARSSRGRRVLATIHGDHYAIAGLEPGEWTLEATGNGYRDLRTTISLSEAEPAAYRDLPLASAARIKVRVLAPDGRALPGRRAMTSTGAGESSIVLVPVATLEPPGLFFADVGGRVDAPLGAGRFCDRDHAPERLSDDCLGVVVLSAGPPVHLSLVQSHLVLATQLVRPGVTEVTFVVDPERVRANLGGLRVRLSSAAGHRPLPLQQLSVDGPGCSRSVTTDARGDAALDALGPGVYRLTARIAAFVTAVKTLAIEPGRISEATLELDPEIVLAGTVVGLPPGSGPATVTVSRFDPILRTVRDARMERTDGHGSFRIGGLAAGEYLIAAVGSRAAGDSDVLVAPPQHVDAGLGSVTSIALRLAPGVTIVIDGSQLAGPARNVQIQDATGLPVWSTELKARQHTALQLPPGSYRAQVVQGGVLVEEHSFTAGGKLVTVRLGP